MKKAQSGLEFLMTYGWAIFIVLVVIGILMYLGVFDLSVYLPETCSGPPGVDCTDFSSVGTDGEVLFQIQNNLGQTINITEGSTTGPDDDCEDTPLIKAAVGKTMPTDIITASDPLTVQSSEYASILVSCGSMNKGRFEIFLNLRYFNLQTSNYHDALFSIKGYAREE